MENVYFNKYTNIEEHLFFVKNISVYNNSVKIFHKLKIFFSFHIRKQTYLYKALPCASSNVHLVISVSWIGAGRLFCIFISLYVKLFNTGCICCLYINSRCVYISISNQVQ